MGHAEFVFPAYAGVNPRGMVFPAYAGVNLRNPCRRRQAGGIPRVCGGEPAVLRSVLREALYSPRMRG